MKAHTKQNPSMERGGEHEVSNLTEDPLSVHSCQEKDTQFSLTIQPLVITLQWKTIHTYGQDKMKLIGFFKTRQSWVG